MLKLYLDNSLATAHPTTPAPITATSKHFIFFTPRFSFCVFNRRILLFSVIISYFAQSHYIESYIISKIDYFTSSLSFFNSDISDLKIAEQNLKTAQFIPFFRP